MNKYMSCTYDPGILMFALSVQDKQDRSPRGVRNKSRDRAYQFEIWRCMYSRKLTSKLQRRQIIFKREGTDVPWIVNPGQDGAQLDPTEVSPSDDATMVEPEANLEK
ncbi:hypothetical protein YC2023_032961 [Brassica napus]